MAIDGGPDPEIYGALIRGFALRESTACKVLLKPPSETHGAWVNSGRNLPGKPPKWTEIPKIPQKKYKFQNALAPRRLGIRARCQDRIY